MHPRSHEQWPRQVIRRPSERAFQTETDSLQHSISSAAVEELYSRHRLWRTASSNPDRDSTSEEGVDLQPESWVTQRLVRQHEHEQGDEHEHGHGHEHDA